MKVALGLKAHSGWAVLVVVGVRNNKLEVVERRRLELVEAGQSWAKQPYHAAEHLKPEQAAARVKRGREAAYRIAQREINLAAERLRAQQHDIVACAVLLPSAMPDWSTEEILSVHFRMHKAEGVLFPDALARAAEKCGLDLVAIPEKQLNEHAEQSLATPLVNVMNKVAALGKPISAPWGKDQKNAALAAIIALRDKSERSD